MHFLITTDLSPIIIREHLNNPRVLSDISAKMDSIICAQLPTSVWGEKQEKEPRDDRWKLKLDLDTEPEGDSIVNAFDSIKRRAYAVARSCMCHKLHAATCSKGEVGKYKCRMAYPRACFNRKTAVLQIMLVKDPISGKLVPKALVDVEPERNDPDLLLKWKDDRIIILELQRAGENPDEEHRQQELGEERTLYWADIAQSENESVVSFSPALLASLGCNANVESLGNLAQAKAATFCLFRF
jgi:hypothetical protein